MRSAISPRLAITTLSSMGAGLLDDEQRLAELHRLAVLHQDGGDPTFLVGFDLIHHFHGFDDAERLADLHFTADVDESLRARCRRRVEGADHWRAHDILSGSNFLSGR